MAWRACMKGPEPGGFGIGGELLEEGRRGRRVTGEQGLYHGEADAAIGLVVLPPVAPVGEVTFDGLALRLRSRSEVSGVRLDAGEDSPRHPQSRVVELPVEFDRPVDFLPCFVEATELAQGMAEIASRPAFASYITDSTTCPPLAGETPPLPPGGRGHGRTSSPVALG